MAFFIAALFVFFACRCSRQKHIELQKFCEARLLQYSKSQGNSLVTGTCCLRNWNETWNFRDQDLQKWVLRLFSRLHHMERS